MVSPQACVKAGIVKEEARKLLARSKDQNVKEKLEATTQEAFGFGVSPPVIIQQGV